MNGHTSNNKALKVTTKVVEVATKVVTKLTG